MVSWSLPLQFQTCTLDEDKLFFTYMDVSSLGRILNIRLPSVTESLSMGILLLRVYHWDVVIIP